MQAALDTMHALNYNQPIYNHSYIKLLEIYKNGAWLEADVFPLKILSKVICPWQKQKKI
jgi:hypothetical protein